jgi:EAL domain-containing protein (putative c-di-GMP-specific phosphodiesterase class I)
MIDMAQHLKYRVVAEGVETQEAYDFLAEAGCDEVQGYHISRPLTANDFRDWLAAPRTFGSRSAA